MYYVKKVSNQDVTRTFVVNAEAVRDFFGVDMRTKHETSSVQIKYIPSNTYQAVGIVQKQDVRLFIERNFEENDIVLFTSQGDNHFDLETIRSSSRRYRVYDLALQKRDTAYFISNALPQEDHALGHCIDEHYDDDDAHEAELLLKSPTEVVQLVKARRGQGVFRERVGDIETRCRLTGVDILGYLRASHIKPWRKSDDREKLDGNNGLMLAPHVDMLFDSGLISFENDGSLIVSCNVDPRVLAAWKVPVDFNAGSFSPKQCVYLEHHRTEELQR
jgi:hypothetical protein